MIAWLKRLLQTLVSPLIEEFREQVRQEFLSEIRVTDSRLTVSLKKVDTDLRRDMVLEMKRVGEAFQATNHQVMMLKHEIILLKLGQPIPEPESAPPRPPGWVDWAPHPAHFGNKIEI
jgi:hypothetical protein